MNESTSLHKINHVIEESIWWHNALPLPSISKLWYSEIISIYDYIDSDMRCVGSGNENGMNHGVLTLHIK